MVKLPYGGAGGFVSVPQSRSRPRRAKSSACIAVQQAVGQQSNCLLCMLLLNVLPLRVLLLYLFAAFKALPV